MKIIQSRSFERKVKRFSKREKKKLDEEIQEILDNPSIGSEKKGDVRGVFVHKFKISTNQYLLAYRFFGENLELITQRIIQTQEAAEGSVAQLQITMPFCEKMLRFDSPLQVEPKAEMAVTFRARPQRIRYLDRSAWYGLGLFAGLLVVGGGIGFGRRRWDRLHKVITPPLPPKPSAKPDKPTKPDEPNGQVSAKELI